MANWQDPRPLFPWSPPPEQQGPRGAPKLRPNIYARMARFAVQNPVGVLLAVLFLLATAVTVAALNLSFDFSRQSMTAGAPQPQLSPAIEKFSDVRRVIWIDLSADAPGTARAAATSLAESLKTQTAIVEAVITPGAEALEPKFRPYFLPQQELQQRVGGILSLAPYYQLLAASPNLSGLNNAVATMKGAADAGQVPAALAPFLDTLAQSVQRLADGRASTIAWPEATGLAVLPDGTSQSLIVIARQGELPAVTDAARVLIAKLQAEKPFLNVASNLPAGSETAPAASSMRQIIVALFLATLFLISSLAFGLRAPRDVFFAIVPPAVASITALALAPALIGPLDAASAMLPMLIVPGTLALSVPYVLALERHEKKAITTQSLIMLAAQQSGTYIATSTAMIMVSWVSWWVFGGGGERGLALTMAIAQFVCALATFLVVPTLAFVIPRERAEIVPAAELAANSRSSLTPAIMTARPWVTLALLALAGISAMLLAVSLLRTPERSMAAVPISLYAADAQRAQRIVAALQVQPQTIGRVRWLGSYLPPDLAAKSKELQRLSALNLPVAPAAATPAQQAAAVLKKIDEGLKDIANRDNVSGSVRDSAQRLRRSMALVQGTAVNPGAAAASIESALFTGLPRFGAFVAAAATVAAPSPSDLPEALRGLYMSADGGQRIDVSPASPTVTAQDFSQAVTTAQPDASDTQPAAGSARSTELLLLLSIAVATLGSVALSLSLLRKPSSIAAFALTQVAAALIFCGLAYGTGLGFTAAVMAAILAALMCTAVSALWVLSEDSQQWASRFGFRHMLQGSVAVIVPLVLLNLSEFMSFATALVMFLALTAALVIFAAPTLETWAVSITSRKPKTVVATVKTEPSGLTVVEKQVSTTPVPDDKKTA